RVRARRRARTRRRALVLGDPAERHRARRGYRRGRRRLGARLGRRRDRHRRAAQPRRVVVRPELDRSTVTVSELFDAEVWREVPGFEGLTDITYHLDVSGRIARVAFHRPEVRTAFRPHTVDELARALDAARQNPRVGSCCSPATERARRTAAGPSARAATSAS